MEQSTTHQRTRKQRVRSESPPPLRPWGKKPLKTIALTLFLFCASLFFLGAGYFRYQEKGLKETYPLFILGFLLLIPGGFYTFILVSIWIGLEGFTYDMLPSQSD